MSGAEPESYEITRVSLSPSDDITERAGSGSTWFTLTASSLHVGKRSSGAPILAQRALYKFPEKYIHAMDQITVLYAFVSFLVLLISSVSHSPDLDLPI